MNELFIQAVKAATGLGNFIPVFMADVTVESVDVKKRTCKVSSSDQNKNIDNLEVRLISILADGELNIPSVDENVTIAWSAIMKPIVIGFGWLDRKTVIIGNQKIDILDGRITLNDSTYGGLVKIVDPQNSNAGLLKKINELEDKLNKVNERLNSFIDMHAPPLWVVVPSDGGAALAAAVGTWKGLNPTIQNISPLTTQEDLENPNIVHGLKIPD